MPIYAFQCLDCEEVTDIIVSSDLRPARIPCPKCPDSEAEYIVGKPAYFRLSIEGNGRKGYKMDLGNGRKVVRSCTRERYEHEAGNRPISELVKDPKKVRQHTQSVYTKEYGRKVAAEKKVEAQALSNAITAMKREAEK